MSIGYLLSKMISPLYAQNYGLQESVKMTLRVSNYTIERNFYRRNFRTYIVRNIILYFYSTIYTVPFLFTALLSQRLLSYLISCLQRPFLLLISAEGGFVKGVYEGYTSGKCSFSNGGTKSQNDRFFREHRRKKCPKNN